jgi:hypothetical protein
MPFKIYPNRDFWLENKPSGNPGLEEARQKRKARNRVTRLGDFSPIWQVTTLGLFLISEMAQNIWQLFILGKSFVLISTKMDLATFWAKFSQTDLVTLV